MKITTVSGKSNRITSMNAARHMVTISNPDNVVSGLEKNDILYIPESKELPDGLLVKIISVSRTGGSVALTCDAPEFDEVIESIDISTIVTARAEDFEDNNEVSITNASTNQFNSQMVGDSGLMLLANNQNYVDFDAETDTNLSIGLDRKGVAYDAYGKIKAESVLHYETESFAEKKGLYAAIDMGLSALVDIRFYGRNFNSNFYMHASTIAYGDVVSGYSNSGSKETKIKLPDCSIPVAGPLKVHIESFLVIGANGEITVESVSSFEDYLGCHLYQEN